MSYSTLRNCFLRINRILPFCVSTLFVYVSVLSVSHLQAETTNASNATLIAALPYTISTSGIYYFNQSLSCTQTTGQAISILASDVTIDFNGYTIFGPNNPSSTCNGIYASGKHNIRIQNGTISGFYYSCRIITTTPYDATCDSYGHLLDNVTFLKNSLCSSAVGGVGCRVSHCRSILSGGTTQSAVYYNFNFMGASNAVVDCDVCGVLGTNESHGIQGSGGSNNFVVGNRISGVTVGFYFNSDAKYRDNILSGVTTVHFGGTDAGNNYPQP